ncbi:MAG: YicC/YloC family endoribonuclease [Thermodesulforhabdaceae bacterium]|jgi:uncharacterized protein (TIGR00255 family)
MIISMTGMIRYSISEEGYAITCEIKSLNGKNLDINVRLPKLATMCEDKVRSVVRSKCRRGRIDLTVIVETTAKPKQLPHIDPYAFRFYYNELTILSKLIPGLRPPALNDLLSIPYIFETTASVDPEERLQEEERLCALILKACDEGLDKLHEMKRREGELLETVCDDHLRRIETLLNEVASRKDEVVIAMRDRMKERVDRLLQDLSATVEDHLILQEIAILADRVDISEELSRLRAHVAHFRKIAFSEKDFADGRQLDFLVQEMHREANTMGAKAADLVISEIVVALKTEIAKLREQVQNIE